MKGSEYKKLLCKVKDHDITSANDLLGYCKIDWKVCLEESNSGKWVINKSFPLKGSPILVKQFPDLVFGEVYV